MLGLVVFADDITGAADAGVQFLPVFAPVHLLDHRSLSLGVDEDPPQAISVFTSSRSLTSAQAGRVVFTACRAVREFNPQRVYKKIDSALRGHVGAELEAAMDALDRPLSFIAPAFPEQGRKTFRGVHLVHEVPVAATEMARDPVTPVTESSLPKWIAMQTRGAVGHVGWETVDAGLEAMASEIERLRLGGTRHITFDATAARHLKRVAQLAVEQFPQALLCGSAGLARGLARRLTPGKGPRAAEAGGSIPMDEGHMLFVCGSASEQLRRQAARLADGAGAVIETLEPADLVDAEGGAARADILRRAIEVLSERDLILRLSPPNKGPTPIDPQRLVVKLAEFAATVMAGAKPAGLFLSGGDTALAVLELLQVKAVRLEKEVSSGLVYGTLLGGPLAGRPVVTKAGSFGPPEALLNMHRAMRPRGGS